MPRWAWCAVSILCRDEIPTWFIFAWHVPLPSTQHIPAIYNLQCRSGHLVGKSDVQWLLESCNPSLSPSLGMPHPAVGTWRSVCGHYKHCGLSHQSRHTLRCSPERRL
jgi:hypothetical protein